MVDYNQVVCCMCGDVGFSDKLFRCGLCHNRLQHSYCSNYYSESSEQIERCDWCQSVERNNSKHGSSSRKSTSSNGDMKSEYSGGDKVKQHDRDVPGDHKEGKNPGHGTPSLRTATRRYKLLKDVLCQFNNINH